MMSTTSESTIRNPSSLSSSDLVSRFLAATPPYLYNVSPVQHNFFFSEMLRSFVHAKGDSVPTPNNNFRRRKRSWKDSRDRPLELTTKEKSHNETQIGSLTTLQNHKDYQLQNNQIQQQQLFQHYQQDYQPQNPILDIKNIKNDHCIDVDQDVINKFAKQKMDNLKSIDDIDFQIKTEEAKKHFAERVLLKSPIEKLFPSNLEKTKAPESLNLNNRINNIDNNYLQYCTRSSVHNPFSLEEKSKISCASKPFPSHIPNKNNEFQSFPNLNISNSTSPDYLPTSVWYSPYPLVQTYPTIDPLHFFIDLRVSGHLLNHKSNEKYVINRNKHNSAFSIPQSKECNGPLNLTRNEIIVNEHISKNLKGTHYIFKNIKRLYKKICNSKSAAKNDITNENFDENTSSAKV